MSTSSAKSRTNLSASVRDRLFVVATANGEEFQLVLTRFAIERLLYRLTQTPGGEAFVLKGAVLFLLWQNVPRRPTRDLDLLGRGEHTPESLAALFRSTCTISVQPDGLAFDADSVVAELNREDLDYPGVRIKLMARLSNARIPVQIDIGFGDAVTPPPVVEMLPALLPFPVVRMLVYPPETVIAEKFQAMVSRGIANTRLKDFYDIWILAQTRPFDGMVVATAIQATFTRRRTSLPPEQPIALTPAFARQKDSDWRAFLRRSQLEDVPVEFEVVIDQIAGFLGPLVETVRGAQTWPKHWHLTTGWRAADDSPAK